MSTLLQLVNRLRTEAGMSGSALPTVIGATGESARAVNWIVDGWRDIQEARPDWNWMRKTVSFSTTTNQGTYTVAQTGVTDLALWKDDSFRCYLTSTGYGSERFLTTMSYSDWRNMYQFNALRTTASMPIVIAVAPDKSLCLGPLPDALGYTVIGEYWSTPSELSLDADTPEMPSRYHMAIVWRALQSYGMYEAAPEAVQRGGVEFARMMRRLEIDQMQPVTVGEALA